MTIICVRDEIMAVDSAITNGYLRVGSMVKWRAVASQWGGGFVAGCGNCSKATKLVNYIADFGLPQDTDWLDDRTEAMWLRADGKVLIVEKEGSHEPEHDFHAIGSGSAVAMGALAMGASAERAVQIASELVDGCGGKIHVLKID